jgi:hypothetical protein
MSAAESREISVTELPTTAGRTEIYPPDVRIEGPRVLEETTREAGLRLIDPKTTVGSTLELVTEIIGATDRLP